MSGTLVMVVGPVSCSVHAISFNAPFVAPPTDTRANERIALRASRCSGGSAFHRSDHTPQPLEAHPYLAAWSTSRGSTRAPATAGETKLGDMSDTTKNDLRLQAYADVDEANAQLGLALATGGSTTTWWRC